MAPTEVLAEQHAETLVRLLSGAGVRLALLTGRVRGAARRSLLAALVIVAPSACANRLGGPDTGFGAPSRGATTRLASAPSGDSFGPVSTRAQKP